ncbi:MAG: nuclease-related domain-containing protein [Thermoanaerobaculia bacterium]
MPPRIMLMAQYSGLLGDGQRSSRNYSEQLRRASGEMPLNVFATINNLLTLDAGASEAHRSFEEELLSESVRRKLQRLRRDTPNERFVAFTRAGALLNLKLLLAVAPPGAPYYATAVGACALHANDFAQSPDTSSLANGRLPVVTEFAAGWESYNPRDIAPILRRSYYIYDRLLKTDANIRQLVLDHIGVEIEAVAFAGLPYRSYFPLLFGLYTTARRACERQRTSIIDASEVAAKASLLPEEFIAFAASKSQTLAEVRNQIGRIDTEAEFTRRVESSAWTSDVLAFRKKPLLVLSDGRYLVADMQFLFENTSAGLSWNFVEALRSKKAKHAFLGYWGSVFERYVQELMEHYLPGAIRRNVGFESRDIDVLVELPDAALVLEVKSGFIPQEVRGCRDQALFRDEIEKKYVVDRQGRAKGVRQLAASARALREKSVPGVSTSFQRIYPILVAEDPVMQTYAMNAYMNELFEREFDRGGDAAPLTVLLIDELEEILPHIAGGDISWKEVLDARLVGDKVVAAPMHTTFAELQAERRMDPRADSFLASHGDELMRMIDDAYRIPHSKAGLSTR